ncbi:MAG: T9SS type A sorting domain-containing protein [Paludibacter sp.]
MLTYQVAYNDDSLTVTNTGWYLPKQPVTVTTTNSRIVTDSVVDIFKNSNYIMIHTGKKHYYSVTNNSNNYCGFSELSQSYQLRPTAITNFFSMEITDTLTGDFGNYTYKRKVTPREKGIFQIAGTVYNNIQCIETSESIIRQQEENKLTKSRLIKSFYQNEAPFPLIEFVIDSLKTDSTIRVIEFILYDNNIISGIKYPQMHELITYPNPAHDIIHIKTEDYDSGTITIISLTGKKIYETNTANNITAINVSTLPEGTYILKYQNKNRITINRLIKQ